jgi:hypothetical protein
MALEGLEKDVRMIKRDLRADPQTVPQWEWRERRR